MITLKGGVRSIVYARVTYLVRVRVRDRVRDRVRVRVRARIVHARVTCDAPGEGVCSRVRVGIVQAWLTRLHCSSLVWKS